jgi:phage baseplate assembly protein V
MPDDTLSPDNSRRIESLNRIGTVSAVDPEAGKCRVKSGQLESEWLRWLERRAGTTNDWDPPTVGEQCLILSPSGEVAGGLVLLGIPSDEHPQPSHDKNTWTRVFPDGARLSHDHSAQVFQLSVPDGGKIVFSIGATTLELRGDGVTLTTPHFEGVQG